MRQVVDRLHTPADHVSGDGPKPDGRAETPN
jgi:hypothetical protein